jgi:23S rRNA (guanosine2251-2'-O)-methyltransferase
MRDLLKQAETARRAHHRRPMPKLDGMVGTRRHQGVVAKVDATRRDIKLADVLDSLDENALILVLDGVQDPHNLGACLRVADAAGAHAVVAPKDRAVGLNATAIKVASGAADTVPYITVTNLARALREMQEPACGSSAPPARPRNLYDIDQKVPVAWVLGAEGDGLRRLTRETCDELARIPMHGSVESLNVSVASGICLFEARRQRGSHEGARLVGLRHVVAEGTAAAGSGRHQPDAAAIEHAGRGGVDVGCQGRLHAALPDQHGAQMGAFRPGAGHSFLRNLGAQCRGQYVAQRLADPQQGGEAAPVRHHRTQGAAQQSFAQRTAVGRLGQFAHDVQHATETDAFRAHGFAGTAGEAAVEVGLYIGPGWLAFERLPDQADAAARTVPVVVQDAEGRAIDGALAALHALGRDGRGFLRHLIAAEFLGQLIFHFGTPYVVARGGNHPSESAACSGIGRRSMRRSTRSGNPSKVPSAPAQFGREFITRGGPIPWRARLKAPELLDCRQDGIIFTIHRPAPE